MLEQNEILNFGRFIPVV